uniref:Profilin n=1 Tax=Panagrellus redivivus TaxID=6233 RepID=A0A7E4W5J5_PANRE
MDLINQFREGFAKAVQLASDNHVFTDFPDCSILGNTDKISIKLKDPLLHNANQFTPQSAAMAIKLLIRDENNRKATIMSAELELGNGLIVRSTAGRPIMIIRTRNNDPSSLGKLMHPAPASLYKIQRENTQMGTNFIVVRGQGKEPVMRVEKVFASIYPIGKAIGLIGSNCVYWFKRMDGTVLGYIRPKLVVSSNTLIVKFTSTNHDVQIRTAMVGVGLLLAVTEAYPQVRPMLIEALQNIP